MDIYRPSRRTAIKAFVGSVVSVPFLLGDVTRAQPAAPSDSSEAPGWKVLAEVRSPGIISNSTVSGPMTEELWWVKRDIPHYKASLIAVKTRVIDTGLPRHPTLVYVANAGDAIRGFNLNYDVGGNAWRLVFANGQQIVQREELDFVGEVYDGQIHIQPDGKNIEVISANGIRKNIFYEPGIYDNGGVARLGFQALNNSAVEAIYVRFSQPIEIDAAAVNLMFAEKEKLAARKQVVVAEGEPREFTNFEEPKPEYKNTTVLQGLSFEGNRLIEASIELP